LDTISLSLETLTLADARTLSAPDLRRRTRQHLARSADTQLILLGGVDEIERAGMSESDLEATLAQVEGERDVVTLIHDATRPVIVAHSIPLLFGDIFELLNQIVETFFHTFEFDDEPIELPIE
jgi:hypothetical protein